MGFRDILGRKHPPDHGLKFPGNTSRYTFLQAAPNYLRPVVADPEHVDTDDPL
jgi:hypothetical protein